jgi:hypothetical protein
LERPCKKLVKKPGRLVKKWKELEVEKEAER